MGLVVREIYFSGVLSLVIIGVSGLFVGMVLGLQGYDTLQRYGSSSALGVLDKLTFSDCFKFGITKVHDPFIKWSDD